MKTAAIICTLVLLLLALPANAQQINQTNPKLRAQQQRLQNIEQLMAKARNSIEYRYQHRLEDMLDQCLVRLQNSRILHQQGYERLFNTEFIEFLQVVTNEPYSLNHLSAVLGPFKLKTTTQTPSISELRLRQALAESYFLTRIHDFLMDQQAHELVAHIAHSTDYSPLVRDKARQLGDILRGFDLEYVRLQEATDAKLAAVDRKERRLKNNVYNVIRQLENLPQTPTYGVVSAICYDATNPICMIDGIDAILKPGSTIKAGQWKGAKVVAIHPNKVEFQKGGKYWTKKVGQTP